MTTPHALTIATRERSPDGGLAGWLPNPDPILKALGRDVTTYRDMRADAHVGGCIRRRKSAVLAMPGALEREGCPARVHKAIEGILADLAATTDAGEPGAQPGLRALLAEALDGALYGYQPIELGWGRVGSLLVPQVAQGKPPEWFVFDTDNQLRFRARGAGSDGERLPPRKFLLARQDPTYLNPYGFADLSMVYWPYTFRRAAKFWVTWLERYGGDFLIGKLPRSASPTEYETLTASLEAMIQDAVAAIPDDGSVEVLASANKGGSSDAHERFLCYWRGEISIALLGSNQGVESSNTLASATAALDVAEDIRDRDAEMVAQVVNQLIRWVVELNWPGQTAPRWDLGADEGIDKTLAERDAILVKAGATFTRAYFLRAYDLEEDDLAAAAAVTPPVAAGGARLPAAADAADAPDAPDAAPVALAGPGVGAAPWGQALIDAEADRDAGAVQQAAMERLLAPILTALAEGLTPEAILGRMDEWYGEMDDTLLQELLTRGVAAADAIGRLEVQQEAAGG